jgi:catechol 2,3-dioxygenase-like lactoylglutathione lyase family enzyme
MQMFVKGLDHFNIWASDVAALNHFYCDIVGLKVGPRPPLNFPGVWLYCGDQAIIHVNLGEVPPGTNTGAVDHLAFAGTGEPNDLTARLEREGIPFRAQTVAGGVRQVFCSDPNGVKIEFNFQPQ